MTDTELNEIEGRLQAGDDSRLRADVRKLIEEVRTLRSYVQHAEETIVQEVLKSAPLP